MGRIQKGVGPGLPGVGVLWERYKSNDLGFLGNKEESRPAGKELHIIILPSR